MKTELDKESIVKNSRPVIELAMRLKIFHLDKIDRLKKMKEFIEFMGIEYNFCGFVEFPVYKYQGNYYH